MSELTAAHLRLLEQLTDPTHIAVADAREALAELAAEVVQLKTATDAEGIDCKDWLTYLTQCAEEAVEDLARLAEARRWP